MLELCNFKRFMEGSADELREFRSSKAHFSAIELLSANVQKPSFSVIVDKLSTFQAGTALLHLQVGGQEHNEAVASAGGNSNALDEFDMKKKKTLKKKKEPDYCFLQVSTADNVKVLAKVPEVVARVNVMNLLNFVLAHFADADRFLNYVAVLTSTKKFNGYQHVEFMRKLLMILIDFMAKPDIDMTVNISTRIIANPSDVIICIENQDHDISALSMRVRVNIVDFLTGFVSLKTSFYKCFIDEEEQPI